MAFLLLPFDYFCPLFIQLTMSKKKRFEIIPSVTIEKAGGEGKALAHIDGKVVFVKYAAPGDVVAIQLTQVKGRFMEGEVHEILSPGPDRVQAICAHFGTCGGCKWQHVAYSAQLEIKNQWALDCLQRIGKVNIENIHPPLGAPEHSAYRNKVEFTFSDKCWEESFDKNQPQAIQGLGFHIPGRWDKVLDLSYCHLTTALVNELRDALKEIAIQQELTFWNAREQTGWLRNLLIRQTNAGDLMLVLAVSAPNETAIMQLFEPLRSRFPQVNSWMYAVNDKRNDSWTGLVPHLYAGKGYMEEKMGDLLFKIRPFSFFQTNYKQACALYELAADWAAITQDDVVYDLYTGTGTIAQFVARKAKRVIGLEYVQSAIDDAIENAALNGLDNTVFLAGDMKELLNETLFETYGRPDVVITDPPRDGMHADVVATLLKASPQRIVYVSCNPATQARDLALMEHQYRIVQSRAVDMFPHTHHVENVVLLIRKD
jgi:23S rRNA (uracil1939-C5)-methyltransferase